MREPATRLRLRHLTKTDGFIAKNSIIDEFVSSTSGAKTELEPKMRKRESSKPTAYADIHRAGRGLREGRPAFARSIGTRANLQARSPFDVSDQALAFAMTSGARGAGLKQQIASQLSGSRRKHTNNFLQAGQRGGALSSITLHVLETLGATTDAIDVRRAKSRSLCCPPVSDEPAVAGAGVDERYDIPGGRSASSVAYVTGRGFDRTTRERSDATTTGKATYGK